MGHPPPGSKRQDLDWKIYFCPVCGMHFAFSATINGESPPACPVNVLHLIPSKNLLQQENLHEGPKTL